jgi:hypothetical protein
MSGHKNYAIDKVVLIVGGSPIEFDEVEIETPDGFVRKVGAQGEVSWSKVVDETATVTITIPQTSEANLILDSFYQADRASPGGITYNCTVKDILGNSLFTCAFGRLMKQAPQKFAAESDQRVWIYSAGKSKSVVGGN